MSPRSNSLPGNLETSPQANVAEEKPEKEISSARKKGNPLTAKQGNRPEPATTPMPGSLRREMKEKQKLQHGRLLIQMDSLYENNLFLNQKQ